MIYSGHGLPRGDNEDIPPRRKWEYFILGKKWGLSVYLARRKQKKKTTMKLKQVKSSLKKKKTCYGRKFP